MPHLAESKSFYVALLFLTMFKLYYSVAMFHARIQLQNQGCWDATKLMQRALTLSLETNTYTQSCGQSAALRPVRISSKKLAY